MQRATPNIYFIGLQHHIFLVGGENINSVEKYDIDKNEWTDAPSLNVAR